MCYNKAKTPKKQIEYYTHLIILQEIYLFFRAEKADDVMLSLSEIKLLALDIENELYDFFKETGHKYKAKYRSLIFNIKDSKNKVSQKSGIKFTPVCRFCCTVIHCVKVEGTKD